MKYENTGIIPIEEADDMNIPINITISETDENSPAYILTADNLMPRKGYMEQSMYEVEANSREILVELVNKHIVPLYEAALYNLKTKGELYYWEKEE